MPGKKPPRDAADLLTELHADERFHTDHRARDAARVALAESYAQAERPIVAELTSSGYDVQSVWDLVNKRSATGPAIGILLKHLSRDYPERVREGIARALAVPDAKEIWGALLELFTSEEDRGGSGVKFAMGCALAAAASPERVCELMRLAVDSRHGRSRAALVESIAILGDSGTRAQLERLRQDADIGSEVARVLRRPDTGRSGGA